jgi:hypothetical protein
MSWGYVAVAAATVISGVMSSNAAGDAADAQMSAEERAIAEQRRAREQMRSDLLPYMDAGQGGLSQLAALSRGDYSGFESSPDYLFAREQMQDATEFGAAARGGLYASASDLQHNMNGLAAQNLGQYRNSLQWLANLGQNAAAGVGQAGMNAAGQIGSSYGRMGDAAANGAMGQANAAGSTLNSLAGLFGAYQGQRNSSYGGNTNTGGGMTSAFNDAWGYT